MYTYYTTSHARMKDYNYCIKPMLINEQQKVGRLSMHTQCIHKIGLRYIHDMTCCLRSIAITNIGTF